MAIKPADLDVKWKKVEDAKGKRYEMMIQHIPSSLVESGEGYSLHNLRDKLVKQLEPRVDEFNRYMVPLVIGTYGVWVKHDGGPNPVPGKGVKYKIRYFSAEYGPTSSENLRWDHSGSAADITEYCMV